MDKYEYQVRSEEIKDLIRKKDYVQAAEIADTIDWRKVKSVVMLCTVSDLYKMNRRYENAKDILLLAYDRRPGARSIVYSLCELCIKTGDLVQAMEYYKEFANIAPRDPGRYILQYKIYEDQDVSLEERIAVLEELKRHDYREKWAYELAYLYHRVGLETRCVEECDELILWFGDGEYVIKAMELKRLHQPLTPEQQKIYDSRFDPKPEEDEEASEEEAVFDEEDKEEAGETQEAGGDTAIWAREAVSTKAAWGDTVIYDPVHAEEVPAAQEQDNTVSLEEPDQEESSFEEPGLEGMEEEAEVPEVSWQEASPEEPEIFVKTMDMSPFNTINLQAELAQELKQLLEQEKDVSDEASAAKTQEFNVGDIESQLNKGNKTATSEADEFESGNPEPEGVGQERFGTEASGETGMEEAEEELEMIDLEMEEPDPEEFAGEEPEKEEAEPIEPQDPDGEEPERQEPESEENGRSELDILDLDEEMPYARLSDEVEDSEVFFGETGEINLGKSVTAAGGLEKKMAGIEPPKAMASVLSQESDGQLRIVLPQNNVVEKQITGQMNIEDVLAEWERMKQENAEKRKEEVRQHVLQQTGNMFTEFEAAVRDGLLEKLEKDAGVAVMPNQEVEESDAEDLDIEKLDAEESDIEELGTEDSDGFVPLDAELFDVEMQEPEVLEGAFPEPDTVKKEEKPETLDSLTGELEERTEAVQAEDFTELAGFEELEEILDPAEAGETEVAAEPAEAEEPETVTESVETEEVEPVAESVETEEVEAVAESVETEEVEAVAESVETEEVEPVAEASEAEESEPVAETAETEDPETVVESVEAEEHEAEAEDVFVKNTGVVTGAIDYVQLEEQLKAESDSKKNSAVVVTGAIDYVGLGERLKPEELKPAGESRGEVAENTEDSAEAATADGADAHTEKVRTMTREEREHFSAYIQSKTTREQIVRAIDDISLAAYTGNVIITGEVDVDTIPLAKKMIREIQNTDRNFSGKVAKISGQGLNQKNMDETMAGLQNGALIIQYASGLNEQTVQELYKALQRENLGIIVVLQDDTKSMDQFLEQYDYIQEMFTSRVDVKALSNDMLVSYGQRYAREQECSIDDLGRLALHNRIEQRQTIDHAVTMAEVREIVDEAIRRAKRMSLGHFADILVGKRFDDEDMIIITEKDFK